MAILEQSSYEYAAGGGGGGGGVAKISVNISALYSHSTISRYSGH
jgi:hypothetical protein